MLLGGYPFDTSSLTIMVQPKMGVSPRVGNPGAGSRTVRPARSKDPRIPGHFTLPLTQWVFKHLSQQTPKKLPPWGHPPKKKHEQKKPVSSQTGIIKCHQTWYMISTRNLLTWWVFTGWLCLSRPPGALRHRSCLALKTKLRSYFNDDEKFRKGMNMELNIYSSNLGASQNNPCLGQKRYLYLTWI